MEFNALGEHVGRGSVTLSSFLGPLVREHVPVLLDDWRHLDEKTKDALWEEIQGIFNLTEEWQKDVVFKQMGCLWRASKSRLSSQVRATKKRLNFRKLSLATYNLQLCGTIGLKEDVQQILRNKVISTGNLGRAKFLTPLAVKA